MGGKSHISQRMSCSASTPAAACAGAPLDFGELWVKTRLPPPPPQFSLLICTSSFLMNWVPSHLKSCCPWKADDLQLFLKGITSIPVSRFASCFPSSFPFSYSKSKKKAQNKREQLLTEPASLARSRINMQPASPPVCAPGSSG